MKVIVVVSVYEVNHVSSQFIIGVYTTKEQAFEAARKSFKNTNLNRYNLIETETCIKKVLKGNLCEEVIYLKTYDLDA